MTLIYLSSSSKYSHYGICERGGYRKEKMSVSVNKYGNTSAASIPLSINQELQNGKIKDDDTLVLVGFGGGLTWGAIVIKWGK